MDVTGGEVELVDDIWIYILTFLSSPEKARLFQISKQLHGLLSNPFIWPRVEIDLTKAKKSPDTRLELPFWTFFTGCCSSVVDLNLTINISSMILSRNEYEPTISSTQFMDHIFSIKTLRRLKLVNINDTNLYGHDFNITRPPACHELQLLNLEEFFTFGKFDSTLLWPGLPNLEELYVRDLNKVACLPEMKKLQRLKLFTTKPREIVDLCPSLKYLIYHPTYQCPLSFERAVYRYRDTLIVHYLIFERIFNLSLDQVKIVAPLITPNDLGRPFLTTFIHKSALIYDEKMLEYLVKEVGLDINGDDYTEYSYRPHCSGTTGLERLGLVPLVTRPIACAIENRASAQVIKLLELGANPDPDGKSLLGRIHELPLLLKMLEYGADPNLSCSDDNSTPISMALIGDMPDSPELVQALIKANCDINYEHPESKMTLLQNAVGNRKHKAVAALLEAGAKITKQCIQELAACMPKILAEQLKAKNVTPDMISMNGAVIAINFGFTSYLAEYFENCKDLRDENGLSLLHRVVLISHNEPKKKKAIKGPSRPLFTNYHLTSTNKSSFFAKKPSKFLSLDSSVEETTKSLNIPSNPFVFNDKPKSDEFAASTTVPLEFNFSTTKTSSTAPPGGFNFSFATKSSSGFDSMEFNFLNTPLELPAFSFNDTATSPKPKTDPTVQPEFRFSSITPFSFGQSGFSFNNNQTAQPHAFSFNPSSSSVQPTPAPTLNYFENISVPPLTQSLPPSTYSFGLSNNNASSNKGMYDNLSWPDSFDAVFKMMQIDVDTKTSCGETPLLIACKGKVDQKVKLKYVQSLLQCGADPNACDNNGWTPLHAACYLSEWAIVFELLKSGASANVQDTIGVTPLMAALYGFKHDPKFLCNKFEESFATVLKEYPVDFSLTENTTKRTLLHLLCCVGGPDIVLPFIDKMSINARDASGFTPLHYAIMFGNDQLIGPLITSGADVNAQTTSLKLTPLMLLLSLSPPSPYESYLANYNTLMRSQYSSTTIEFPAKYYMRTPEYINPPWFSSECHLLSILNVTKSEAVIELLLSKSDLKLKDVRNNNLSMSGLSVQNYIEKFPDLNGLLNETNDDKLTPNAQLSVIGDTFNELLTRGGLDVNDRDANGNTALHIACQLFHLGVLDARHGKLENTTEARSFCYYAFKLLDAGADPTVKNNKGETPLDYVPELMEYYKEIYPKLK